MRAADFDQIIVVDIETTGLGPGARPVEVAWIQVDHDLNEVARAGSLVNPGMPIEPGASAVNGITDAMVAESPTLEHLVRSIHGDPFAAGRTLVIAHNAPFDSPHFAPFFDTSESLCTMRLSRHLADYHEDGIDGLLALSGRALFEMNMPFGKHKNTPIADLPSSYVKWMRSEMDDLDGDLLACLDLHHSSA